MLTAWMSIVPTNADESIKPPPQEEEISCHEEFPERVTSRLVAKRIKHTDTLSDTPPGMLGLKQGETLPEDMGERYRLLRQKTLENMEALFGCQQGNEGINRNANLLFDGFDGHTPGDISDPFLLDLLERHSRDIQEIYSPELLRDLALILLDRQLAEEQEMRRMNAELAGKKAEEPEAMDAETRKKLGDAILERIEKEKEKETLALLALLSDLETAFRMQPGEEGLSYDIQLKAALRKINTEARGQMGLLPPPPPPPVMPSPQIPEGEIHRVPEAVI